MLCAATSAESSAPSLPPSPRILPSGMSYDHMPCYVVWQDWWAHAAVCGAHRVSMLEWSPSKDDVSNMDCVKS